MYLVRINVTFSKKRWVLGGGGLLVGRRCRLVIVGAFRLRGVARLSPRRVNGGEVLSVVVLVDGLDSAGTGCVAGGSSWGVEGVWWCDDAADSSPGVGD